MTKESNGAAKGLDPATITACGAAQANNTFLIPYNSRCSCTRHREFALDIKSEIVALLDEILSLDGRSASFTEDTALLGALPELDSMAVVALITSIEERFGFSVDDDEIDGATFATVGSLIEFVEAKLAA
jgi:acyl carrier protein